jgi:hypothetical protein
VWVHPPHVMTKLERDEDLVSLIQASKISYVKGLTNVWDSWNWIKFSSKKECKKGVHSTCELTWIENDSWLVSSIIFNFHFKFALSFKHMFFKLYWLVYLYVHFRIRSTTKEAFITNVVKTILGKLAITHLIIC